jgi:cysteine desulfurase
VANIVGFGAAAQLAAQDFDAEVKRMRYLRDLLETSLLAAVPGAWRNGPETERVPGISNIAFPKHEGEEVLYYLDSLGVCVSTGSACSSGDLDASHVLLAMGQDHAKARHAVRFSVGRGLSDQHIQQVVKEISAWMNPDGDLRNV